MTKTRIGVCALVEPGKIFTNSKDGSLESFMENHVVVLEQTKAAEGKTDDGESRSQSLVCACG